MKNLTKFVLGMFLVACTPVDPDDGNFRSAEVMTVYNVMPTSPPAFQGRATITELGRVEIALALDLTGAQNPHTVTCDVSHLSCEQNEEWECEIPKAGLVFSGMLCMDESYWGGVQTNDGDKEKPHLLSLQTKQQLQSW